MTGEGHLIFCIIGQNLLISRGLQKEKEQTGGRWDRGGSGSGRSMRKGPGRGGHCGPSELLPAHRCHQNASQNQSDSSADLSQESTEWGRPVQSECRCPHTCVQHGRSSPWAQTINKQHLRLGRVLTRRLLCVVALAAPPASSFPGALLLKKRQEVFPHFFFFFKKQTLVMLPSVSVSPAVRGDLCREQSRGGDIVPGQLQRVRPPNQAVAVHIHAGDLRGRQVPGGKEERLNQSVTASPLDSEMPAAWLWLVLRGGLANIRSVWTRPLAVLFKRFSSSVCESQRHGRPSCGVTL